MRYRSFILMVYSAFDYRLNEKTYCNLIKYLYMNVLL
jgi:hypothetical protein